MTQPSIFKVTGLTRIRELWGDDPGEFLLQLHCEVTKTGDPGGEAFAVTVASPKQLSRELQPGDGMELGRGYLFALDYDEKAAIAHLQAFIDASVATSWEELATYVTKYFDWID